jgi:hypothetical protein
VDLKAEVFLSGEKISEGQLNNVASGSSGFNNAKLNTIPLTLATPVELLGNDELEITLSVRRTCFGGGHNSGTPRLWFNDSQADSGFGATIDEDTTSAFFLRELFTLTTDPGTGPKQTIDVPVNSKVACPDRPFKPFGTWSMTLPSSCDDGNACTSDSCDPITGCRHDPVSCHSGSQCITDTCDPDTGCVSEEVSCDDQNECTIDSCDEVEGCTHVEDPSCDGDNP